MDPDVHYCVHKKLQMDVSSAKLIYFYIYPHIISLESILVLPSTLHLGLIPSIQKLTMRLHFSSLPCMLKAPSSPSHLLWSSQRPGEYQWLWYTGEMDGPHGTHGREQEWNHTDDWRIYRRITLKSILTRQDGKVWSGFIWLRIVACGGLLWTW